MKTDAILADLHVPYYDKNMFDLVVKYLSSLDIDTLYLNGDMIDFCEISKFKKEAVVMSQLQINIDHLEYILNYLTHKVTKKIVYIKGNHEYRLKSYLLEKAPELSVLRCLQFETLTNMKKLGITYVDSVDNEAYIKTPYGLWVGHFNKSSKFGGYTAKSIVTDKGVSCVQAHTHKIGSHLHITLDGDLLEGYECGCLCDPSQSYKEYCDWHNGFGIVRYKNGLFQYEQKIIKKRKSKYIIEIKK